MVLPVGRSLCVFELSRCPQEIISHSLAGRICTRTFIARLVCSFSHISLGASLAELSRAQLFTLFWLNWRRRRRRRPQTSGRWKRYFEMILQRALSHWQVRVVRNRKRANRRRQTMSAVGDPVLPRLVAGFDVRRPNFGAKPEGGARQRQ